MAAKIINGLFGVGNGNNGSNEGDRSNGGNRGAWGNRDSGGDVIQRGGWGGNGDDNDGGGNADRVIILDTTLRDGEQTPGVNLNIDEKLEIAKQLEPLGVDFIEAGFPAASPGDFDAVKAIAHNVGCGVAAMCRCVESDIRRSWEAIRDAAQPRLHLVIATSDIHMQYKLRMTPDDVLRRASESVRLAKSLCADVEFSCEDATRSDISFLYSILEAAIYEGATTINIADTVGYSMPGEFGDMIRKIRANVPNIGGTILSVHCHNDLGLAVANTLSAIENGARQIETTINGLGERAGNCPMEEVVMSIATRSALFGISHGIDTTRIHRTSQRVARLTGIPVPVNKAIVGQNAFTHQSGIHQHGMLSNPMTYEIMTPQSVGKPERTLVLGKLSGRHAFADRLRSMGFDFAKEDIDSAFARFIALADRKKNITDGDLEAIANSLEDVPEVYKLTTYQIQSGNRIQSLASVTLLHDGAEHTEAATGDGPIDAVYNAAEKIVGGKWPLASYDIKAVTEGVDALGEVIVRVHHEDRQQVGRGLSTDIIEASIFAYINAINRALSK
ncbi:MAG: 2-isopropylmalate synthase [Oscillospiraceae bacterium]|nr:2-isopropylmalate synthase [Oscillospiraceae bacterium]